jgi:hypothetical protein
MLLAIERAIWAAPHEIPSFTQLRVLPSSTLPYFSKAARSVSLVVLQLSPPMKSFLSFTVADIFLPLSSSLRTDYYHYDECLVG